MFQPLKKTLFKIYHIVSISNLGDKKPRHIRSAVTNLGLYRSILCHRAIAGGHWAVLLSSLVGRSFPHKCLAQTFPSWHRFSSLQVVQGKVEAHVQLREVQEE